MVLVLAFIGGITCFDCSKCDICTAIGACYTLTLEIKYFSDELV